MVRVISIFLEWDKIIHGRVIGYTWCDDLFMVPDDPYGRRGRSIEMILHKQKIEGNGGTQSANALETRN